MVCLPVPPLAQEITLKTHFGSMYSAMPAAIENVIPSEPGAIRTHGPRLKRALLYQLSYGLPPEKF